MERETLIYFLFAVVASLILLSLPVFIGSVNPIYLFLLLFAMGIIWFVVRMLYYKRLRKQQAQNNSQEPQT